MNVLAIRVVNDVFLRANAAPSDLALWCLHGFADCGAAFAHLFETPLGRRVRMMAPDLPGFGASPRGDHGGTIADHVATLLGLIEEETPDMKIGLVGHSVGSVIAAEAARQLGPRCAGMFSIEGNLTADDAYFSGQAVDYENAADFKNLFTNKIWERSADSIILRLYHGGLMQADAGAMWTFGRDVKSYSRDDQPGHVLKALDCPVHYFWCADNTPETTQKFLRDHALPNTEVTGTSHWPMLDAPDKVGACLELFFRVG
ncbi:MAG: alpha/beta hydrolase [Rhodospirillales bacterium]|nr:alpha/beta hydrolase [Rhodospirillales bacterium]